MNSKNILQKARREFKHLAKSAISKDELKGQGR